MRVNQQPSEREVEVRNGRVIGEHVEGLTGPGNFQFSAVLGSAVFLMHLLFLGASAFCSKNN